VQLDGLVEMAQIVDVARDDRRAFSTCHEDHRSVDDVRCLSLAAEDPNGFGQDLIERHYRRGRGPREGTELDLLRRSPPNLSEDTRGNDDSSAGIEGCTK
jgi:hypothetical protein